MLESAEFLSKLVVDVDEDVTWRWIEMLLSSSIFIARYGSKQ